MQQLFKTVLILSAFGFGLTAILLLLKPITSKKFPARWQYLVWIAVMISMLVPIYKFIPQQEAQKLVPIRKPQITEPVATDDRVFVNLPDGGGATVEELPLGKTPAMAVRLWDTAAYIWFLGMCMYLAVVFASYLIYLAKKRKSSKFAEDSTLFDLAKSRHGISRKIRLKTSADIGSPMLVGVFRPTVYIPDTQMTDESLQMVFLHELTHYKRKDLAVKWLAVFVNAVHWFNPLAYILCANVGEACEISCDMAVTKDMPADEQKLYMKTILDLAN